MDKARKTNFFLNYRSFIFNFSNNYTQKIYIFQAVPFTSFWSLYWGAGASTGGPEPLQAGRSLYWRAGVSTGGPEPPPAFNITMSTDKYLE